MRWTKKRKPMKWDIREQSGFLWLPMTINRETRWLEHARWSERHEGRGRWALDEWIDDFYTVTDQGKAMLKDGK